MPRQSLGRGLSALMGDEKPSANFADGASRIESGEIDIDLIDPNPDQPRSYFGDHELDQLAASIRSNGIVQPIVVRRRGSRFQIVAGERRWRAAQRAELRKIPAAIRDIDDDRLLEVALIENIQRQELNPIEEANAYRKLIETIGLTQEQIAERVGKERSLIATTMRLLRLSNSVQRLLVEGRFSLSHGRALLLTDDPEIQQTVANEIIENDLSVRETEKRVKAGIRGPRSIDTSIVTRATDPNVKVAETRLMRKLSTGVKIVPGKKGTGGKIEIEYYGTDDLDRLYQLLIK